MFGPNIIEQNEFEVDYWKDHRFLRNRRDAFILKKYVSISSLGYCEVNIY